MEKSKEIYPSIRVAGITITKPLLHYETLHDLGVALQIGRSLVRSQLVSVDFSLTKVLSDRTVALGSTQILTEMNTRSISRGKGGRCVRLTTYHHPVPLSRNLGTLTSWNPLRHSRPVTGLIYLFHALHLRYSVTRQVCATCISTNNFFQFKFNISQNH